MEPQTKDAALKTAALHSNPKPKTPAFPTKSVGTAQTVEKAAATNAKNKLQEIVTLEGSPCCVLSDLRATQVGLDCHPVPTIFLHFSKSAQPPFKGWSEPLPYHGTRV